jgi:hypothetical protein
MATSKEKVEEAINNITEAKTLRATAKELESLPCGDPLGASFMRLDADSLEDEARKSLQINEKDLPQVGAGGELTITKEQAIEAPKLINTVDKPDNITAEASRDRLRLTVDADCTGMALDAAETIQAKNSLEKMLAHQLAIAHKLAMTFAKKALDHSNKPDRNTFGREESQAVETSRMIHASARMMDIYQKGILALNKVRTGGQQTVTVQHVNVSGRGQAMVTGSIKAGSNDEKHQ